MTAPTVASPPTVVRRRRSWRPALGAPRRVLDTTFSGRRPHHGGLVLRALPVAVAPASRSAGAGDRLRRHRDGRLRHRSGHPGPLALPRDPRACRVAPDGSSWRSSWGSGCGPRSSPVGGRSAGRTRSGRSTAWSLPRPPSGRSSSVSPRLLAVLILVVARGLRLLFRTVFRWLGRRLPRRVAAVVGSAVLLAVIWSLLTGVLVNGFFAVANNIFAPRDTLIAEDMQPTSGAGALGQPAVVVELGAARAAGPLLRRWWPVGGRPQRGERRRRQGADPRLRRTALRRHRAGPREPRAGGAEAHRRLRPQGPRRRHDDRHRLPRPERHRPARVPLERRHRHRGGAVLLPPVVDLAARRPGRRA